MKVVLVMVATVNGKTTKGDTQGTSSWASAEDQNFFLQTKNNNNLLIMGSKTYDVAKSEMKLTPDRLRIILTSRPEAYQKDFIKDQLEFSSDQPRVLIESLAKRGFTQAILLGGASTNKEFLQAGLVDELWLTLEPKIFGTGNDLLSQTELEMDLELLSSEKINAKGTLLLKYAISQ